MKKKMEKIVAVILSFAIVLSGISFANTTKADDTLYGSATTSIKATAGYASSNLRTGVTTPLKVNNLTDGNSTSYIILNTKDVSDNHWFVVDLGAVYDINKVTITPGADNTYANAYPISYEIQVSSNTDTVSSPDKFNDMEWETVETVDDGTMSGKSITFKRQNARYVRLYVNTYKDYCSLCEMSVFQTDDSYLLGEEPSNQDEDDDTTDILFIGNSMTYYNTLCNVVEGLANYYGHKVKCSAATNGGQTLISNAGYANVQNAIKEGGHDIVVLQDIVGSFDGDNLMTGVSGLKETILQYNPNARIVLYMPWPVESKLTGTNSLEPYFAYWYIKAARTYGATLAPAGEAFYDAFTNGYNYYTGDGKHPLPLGTFVSATSVFYTLFPEETQKTFSQNDFSYVSNLIKTNIAYATDDRDSYDIDELNFISEKSYKYSHAVASAVADTSGKTKYTSIAGDYSDPDDDVESEDAIETIGTVVESNYFTKANGNMAIGCKAYASSGTPDNAVDGDTATRWESNASDPQWMYVDLGETKSINQVGFMWEGAFASKYYIQISDDAIEWQTICIVRATTNKNVILDLGQSYNTRYVRMLGTKRGTGYGYSFYEMGVFNSDKTIETTTREQGAVDTITFGTPSFSTDSLKGERYFSLSWTKAENASKYTTYIGSEDDGNIAKAYHNNYSFKNVAQASVDHILAEAGTTVTIITVGYDSDNNVVARGTVNIKVPEFTDAEKLQIEKLQRITTEDNYALNKTALVSSNNTGSNIFDGNLSSMWQAKTSDESHAEGLEYFGVDLGNLRTIGEVLIVFEASYAQEFSVYVAGEDEVYGNTPVASGSVSANQLTSQLSFEAVQARYVKVVVTKFSTNAKAYGTAVYEMGVFGTSSEETTVEPTAQETTVEPTAQATTVEPSTAAETIESTAQATTETSVSKTTTANAANVITTENISTSRNVADTTTSLLTTDPITAVETTTVFAIETDTTETLSSIPATSEISTVNLADNNQNSEEITAGESSVKENITTEKKVYIGKAKVKRAKKSYKAKKIKLVLKKVIGAKKYQIQISTKKTFKTKLVNRIVKKVKTTIKNKKLANKKKLFVRSRAIIIISGKKHFGQWSNTKKINIKK